VALYTLSLNPDKEKKTSKTGNHANVTNGQRQRRDKVLTPWTARNIQSCLSESEVGDITLISPSVPINSLFLANADQGMKSDFIPTNCSQYKMLITRVMRIILPTDPYH